MIYGKERIDTIVRRTKIRTKWDDEKQKWFFSIIDVCGVLTDQPDEEHARNYWKVLKHRLKKEGNETVTNCNQLKLLAADGKMRLTDVAESHIRNWMKKTKMAGDWHLSRTTTALARADCKGGVCIGLADNYQFIVWQVVPDRMSKRYALSACYVCGIDAAMVELVKECLVVVGSHGGPPEGDCS